MGRGGDVSLRSDGSSVRLFSINAWRISSSAPMSREEKEEAKAAHETV